MIHAVVIVLSAIIALVNTTWLSDLSLFGARPDLIAIIIAYNAHRQGVQKGQLSAFAVGVIEDFLSAAPLGFYAIVRLIQGAVVGVTHGKIHGDMVIAPVVISVTTVFLRIVTSMVVTAVTGIETATARTGAVPVVVEIVLTALIAPVLFLLLDRLFNRLQGRRSVA
ncbi:MAG: rod shape-determining protein MreD [Alkalispirochaeta sp.]